MIKTQEKIMQVWLGELHAYNCGYLVGQWIELPTDEEEIKEIMDKLAKEARRITKNPYAGEEWYLGDWENIPFPVHEYDSIFTINEKLQMIADFTDEQIKVLEKYLEIDPMMPYQEAVQKVKNGEYHLFYDCYSMTDVAYAIWEETGYVDEYWVNIEQLIEEAEINRDIPEDLDQEEKEYMAKLLLEEGVYNIEWYIDFEGWGRELKMDGEFYDLGNGLYVELIF